MLVGSPKHPWLLRLYAQARTDALPYSKVLSCFSWEAGLPRAHEDVVHSDSSLLFPDAYLPTPASGLVIGVPVADLTEES